MEHQMTSDSLFAKFLDANHPLFAVTLVVVIGLGLLWLFMLLDCAIRSFEHRGRITGKEGWDKFIWILIVLTGIGAIVYYFVVRRRAPHVI